MVTSRHGPESACMGSAPGEHGKEGVFLPLCLAPTGSTSTKLAYKASEMNTLCIRSLPAVPLAPTGSSHYSFFSLYSSRPRAPASAILAYKVSEMNVLCVQTLPTIPLAPTGSNQCRTGLQG